MDTEFITKLLMVDANAQVACEHNHKSEINYISLQTTAMGKVFRNFPEVLLMLRSHNMEQRALYVFLADGPRVGAPYDIERMVHLAVPPDESPSGLMWMFRIMKSMNPQWPSIKVFLVDPGFKEVDSIYQSFPSAEVVVSALHVYCHINECIKQQLLPIKTCNLLLCALKTAGCSATESNMKNMYQLLQRFVHVNMLGEMNLEWLLVDRVWALTRWRSWYDSCLYFDMMGSVSKEFKKILNTSVCLLISMSELTSFILKHTEGKSPPQARACSPEELAVINCKEETSKKVENPQMESESAALMCESLNKICNPAAFRLCQNELDVTQKSLRLVGTKEDQSCVQILENPCRVGSGECKTCTCDFNQSTKLPCRHILTLLHTKGEVLQPDMVHPAWQKQPNGPNQMLPVSQDTLKILQANRTSVSEKHLIVNSLTSQISMLLADCSHDLFQQRYNILRELADAWIGPYEQVKL